MALKKAVLVVVAAAGGLVLAPFIWAVLTGIVAGLLSVGGVGVPGFLTLGAGIRAAPIIAVFGALAAVYVVVSD